MDNSKKTAILLAGTLLTMMISATASASNPYPYPYNQTSAQWMGVGLAVCGIIIIIWFIVWILVAIWVYRDAEKRGKSGALWLIVVILLGIIGLIIWLVVRGDTSQKSSRQCPNCGRTIPEDARSCPYCNKKFEEQP